MVVLEQRVRSIVLRLLLRALFVLRPLCAAPLLRGGKVVGLGMLPRRHNHPQRHLRREDVCGGIRDVQQPAGSLRRCRGLRVSLVWTRRTLRPRRLN